MHAPTHTHACIHTHTHTFACTPTHMHTQTHTHTHTCTHTHARTHAHTQSSSSSSLSCTLLRAGSPLHQIAHQKKKKKNIAVVYNYSDNKTPNKKTEKYRLQNSEQIAPTPLPPPPPTPTHTHSLTHMCTHPHPHTCTHTHMHTHACTHMHTHSLSMHLATEPCANIGPILPVGMAHKLVVGVSHKGRSQPLSAAPSPHVLLAGQHFVDRRVEGHQPLCLNTVKHCPLNTRTKR